MSSESERFLGLERPLPPPNPSEIRLRYRLAIYFGTWAVSPLLLLPYLHGALFLPFLPLGVPSLFGLHVDGVDTVVAVGWCLYILHGVALLATRRIVWFGLLYALFVLVLMTNVVGCRVMMEGLSKVGH